MQFWKHRKLLNWHKKSTFALLPTKWTVAILLGLIVIGMIYFLVALGSLRFFLGNYFSIAGLNKNYLIILQNQSESRPTGGFVSAYGILKFRFFLPVDLEIQDSFKIGGHEYIEPPKPMGELLADPWYEGYTFRDANWNPDFPQSAQELISFYHKVDAKTEFAGVIAINYKTVENLVNKFGFVKIFDQKLTGSNLFHFLEYETKNIDKHDEKALAGRKNVLKELAGVLMKKSFLNPVQVAGVLNQALAQKELQIWFGSEQLETKIMDKKWGGNFLGNPYADNLGVVFANLGGKKADRYVRKKVDYVVNFRENEAPEAHLKITFQHHGDYGLMSDQLKGYLRVYLPQEADYVVKKEQDKILENNFQVIGQKILLEPGAEQMIEMIYKLPSTVLNRDKYFLNLYKQSGAEMEYSVVLKAPGEMSFQTPDFVVRENRAFFQGELTSDQNFVIAILADQTPPLIYEQKFDEINQIAVIFNEKIDPLNANEKANFEIVDTNAINSKLDTIKIKKVAYDGDKIIRIYTEGITDQPLERYQLTLKNLQDEAGNLLMPSPKIVTVVQRFDK